MKILLVEDDPSLSMVIRETLELDGFQCICAENGIKGLQLFLNNEFDVVVADIMMPQLDGIEMVKRIRQRDTTIPILFLTAKSSVENVIEGFGAGADDYLRKPFSMKELIVRINALYSRAAIRQQGTTKNTANLISIGSYSFDPISQFLHHGSDTVKLSSKENEILRILADNINEMVTAAEIMNKLWEDDSYYIANSLQVFISRLRNRFKNDSSVRIVNARGVGYKLVIDIPDK